MKVSVLTLFSLLFVFSFRLAKGATIERSASSREMNDNADRLEILRVVKFAEEPRPSGTAVAYVGEWNDLFLRIPRLFSNTEGTNLWISLVNERLGRTETLIEIGFQLLLNKNDNKALIRLDEDLPIRVANSWFGLMFRGLHHDGYIELLQLIVNRLSPEDRQQFLLGIFDKLKATIGYGHDISELQAAAFAFANRIADAETKKILFGQLHAYSDNNELGKMTQEERMYRLKIIRSAIKIRGSLLNSDRAELVSRLTNILNKDFMSEARDWASELLESLPRSETEEHFSCGLLLEAPLEQSSISKQLRLRLKIWESRVRETIWMGWRRGK